MAQTRKIEIKIETHAITRIYRNRLSAGEIHRPSQGPMDEDEIPFADVEQPDLLLFAESGVEQDAIADPAQNIVPCVVRVARITPDTGEV